MAAALPQRSSQSVLVRGLVTRGADSLRPGQATTVDLDVGKAADSRAVQVPAGAVLHHEGKQWVFVAATEGKASGYRATPVQPAGRVDDNLLVNGLPAEATIATAGIAALKANLLGMGR